MSEQQVLMVPWWRNQWS